MESKANYTIVGIAVLILSVGFLSTALWLSIGFDNKKYNKYLVYMRESVSGLNEDSIVKFNGVKVGFIDQIQLSQADPQQVKIVLRIQEGTPITTSTQATLVMQGITGTTYLSLTATGSTNIPLQKTPGEPYPVIPYKPSFFHLLEKNVTEISQQLKRIISKENAQNLKITLAHLKTLTDVIARNEAGINQTLHDLPVITRELKDSIQHLTTMAKDVSSAGKHVSTTMKAGRNTIDKISQQAVPPAVLLLRRMDNIAINLEQLSVQLRQNPSIIIRGSTPPKLGPGEKRD